MKDKKNVKFVRIRGKIVPIRVKKGSGSRGGRLEAANNTKQKVGDSLLTAANLSSLFAITGGFFGNVFKSAAKIEAVRTVHNAKVARGLKRINHPDLGRAKKATLGAFKNQKRFKHIGDTLSNKKIRAAMIGIAAVSTISSIALQISGQKQKGRESRALNRLRNK